MKNRAYSILTKNILPFWMTRMPDTVNGGFLGRIDAEGRPDYTAPKGAILNGRILWAFSAAYRVTGIEEYLKWAEYSYIWVRDHLIDRDFGGVYWSCDPSGAPLETKKQSYAIGFVIYGLSEYVRALEVAGVSFTEPLEEAISLYHCLEEYALDRRGKGYFEAFSQDWSPIEDMRLSERDMNVSKTMNTHLHIIEPYTNLYRIWPSDELRDSIEGLLSVFTEKIIDSESGHMGLFFSDSWHRVDNQISFGHEIEAYWLLNESIRVLGNVRSAKIRSALSLLEERCLEFFDEYTPAIKGLPYETREDGSLDLDRHWWVQAEAVVGYWWIHRLSSASSEGTSRELTASETALGYSRDTLSFIENHLLRPDGEWLWSVHDDGSPNTVDDLAGFWKCPYHNSRMCLELIENS